MLKETEAGKTVTPKIAVEVRCDPNTQQAKTQFHIATTTPEGYLLSIVSILLRKKLGDLAKQKEARVWSVACFSRCTTFF